MYIPAKPAPTTTASNTPVGSSLAFWFNILSPISLIRCVVGCPACKAVSIGNLVQERAVRKRGTTGKRGITDSGLPVPGNDELSAIEKLGSSQEGPRKIGTIEYRFKKVRTVETGARQIRIAEVSPSQISAPKVRPRKIETSQINASQTGPRQ